MRSTGADEAGSGATGRVSVGRANESERKGEVMVFGRCIPEHLVWWAVLALLSVGVAPPISPRCADAAPRSHTVDPRSEAAVDLTGEWTGTYHPDSGGEGTVSASFDQNGRTVTGSMTVAGSDCFSLLSFAGTVDGNMLTGTFTDDNSRMDITGLINRGEVNGTYTILAGPCADDTGTFALVAVSPTPTPTPTPPTPGPCVSAPPTLEPCAGDCNGDGTVTVDEIITMVKVALGNVQVSDCQPGDANGDTQITVDEILKAVNNALNAGLDVTGYWDVDFSLPGGCQPGWVCSCSMSLSQSGPLVNGTLVCRDPSSISGAVCGNSIALTFCNCVSGDCFWVSMTGTATSNYMNGPGSPEGTWSATKQSGGANNIITTTIPVNAPFSFSTGTTVISGGDMEYVDIWSGGTVTSTATASLLGTGVSGNFGNSYRDFMNLVSMQTFLPATDHWWSSEVVYWADGSFDARNKWTRWFKTTEHRYAIVFVQSADSDSITIKWVYPYGSFAY
jgi:hypothetical protein